MSENKESEEKVNKKQDVENTKKEDSSNNSEKVNDKKEEASKENHEAKKENTFNEAKLKKDFDELNDRYKRLFAEFENYKKRTQKETLNKRAEITKDVVSQVLPVLDNLEKASQVSTDDKNYQDGIKLVVKQFQIALQKLGMEEIEAVGQKFDPALHEAVSHVDDPSKGDGEIVQEYRKGYKIGDKVIRHSMVIVAN